MLSTLLYITLLLFPIITYGSDDSQILEAISEAMIENIKRVKKTNSTETPICFEDIDCFLKNGPMKHIGSLPASPEKIKTRFFAYKDSDSKIGHEINAKVPQSLGLVHPNHIVVIIIHGFANSANRSELIALKSSLIQMASIPIVILVDWSKGAVLPWYSNAAINTQVVGRQIAVLVNKLIMSRGISPFNVHLIGHSLGAHIAGFAGKYSKHKFKWMFGRITALDAAGPLFEGFAGSHVTKEDAVFVDAIHTSIGDSILKGKVGFTEPIGSIDFYPNNGTRQPMCHKVNVLKTCDHNSALHYMESSLNPGSNCSFTAFKCKSWTDFVSGNCEDKTGLAVMGYLSVLSNSRGNHYLKTTPKFPFC